MKSLSEWLAKHIYFTIVLCLILGGLFFAAPVAFIVTWVKNKKAGSLTTPPDGPTADQLGQGAR